MSQDIEQPVKIAKEAALSAGRFLMENFGRLDPTDIEEKSFNSFVTYVDKQSEGIIVDLIKEHYPDHTIIAEESGKQKTESEFVWFIDPLDGTTNYIKNLPHFSISIALQLKGRIIAGVVFNPILNEMFFAAKGKGAFINDKSIHVTNDSNFGRAVLATGFPHRVKRFLPEYLPAFQEIMLNCSGIRRLGSAALDLCYAACGRFDCYWELGVSPWDVAAGTLIVQEAGGVVSDFWGREDYLENGFIIAGNSQICIKLQKILSFHFKSYSSI